MKKHDREHDENLNEARLRAKRVSDFLELSEGMRTLLIGEHEGILASIIESMSGCSAVWYEPVENPSLKGKAKFVDYNSLGRPIGDPYELPYEDKSFDRLASQFTLNLLSDPQRALTNWFRVLKNGGLAVLVTLNSAFTGWHQRPLPRLRWTYSKDKLWKMLEQAGFLPLKTTSLIPNLRLPLLYRGDLSFCLKLERFPVLSARGKILIISSIKP